MKIGRGFNAACYVATGVLVIAAVIAGASGMSAGYVASGWVGGLCLVGYGLKVATTSSSYFIHSAIYFAPFIGAIFLISLVAIR